ncbi:MAG TPA: hypothetical protein V6D10_07320 [Trichocoleus sp.]|jgi:hypothetical protein
MNPQILKQICLGLTGTLLGVTVHHATNWLFIKYPASFILGHLISIAIVLFGLYLLRDAIQDFLGIQINLIPRRQQGGKTP